MPVTPIAGAPAPIPANTATATAAASAPKKALDSEVFMKLLVTQLTNQDPSTPMDTNQMISQTTQLAMMEQLTAMSRTSTEAFALDMRQAASTLIGQQAGYLDAKGAAVTGIVTTVSFDGPIPQVTIGDATVALDEITSLATAPTRTSA
ncbi:MULTISPECIES: flagellar hook capping FlgD N-terminal domain-containing protein [unclassified Microbacterium]|jgi:flagellar basal-body rod modification protein FlgD|uniref:flagellar hook capping FlgD N-terminal domain-containing protein n=1 Tax=unclassified Microbacterium TaxID=2609290 RepID=UPI0006F54D29|nr:MULTISPECIES: flagellar hook capping FlgD N-terminal domain-containing protein [unclassified Microbacterium]KQM40219.1 flagellar hook capping protein [Microbacterium sp. Leaf203]MCY1716641.1 flagellar hook capping protein [Microbacterium sp. SL62]